MLHYINGNILEYKSPYYICHQCNCVTKTTAGLSEAIFMKYPDANVYIRDDIIRIAGNILITNNVINMFGQVYPSTPKYGNDSVIKRIEYFKLCLDKISSNIPENANIVFPYKIGCGFAGGDWKIYNTMIIDFAEKHPLMNIVIVKNIP
jgi:hypothetical protein